MALITKDGGDGAIPEPPPPTALGFEVAPEDVVGYGVVFQQESDKLRVVHRHFRREGEVIPWLGDPVANWAAERFNQQFQMLSQRIEELGTQFFDVAQELRKSAARYGKTDELNAALLKGTR